MAERVRRYRERVADGSTVGPEMRDAVRFAAARVPVGGRLGRGPRRHRARARPRPASRTSIAVVVAAEDVRAGKPDPEGYLLARERLGVEPAGDASSSRTARRASRPRRRPGCAASRCSGRSPRERLAAADEIVDRDRRGARRAARASAAARPGAALARGASSTRAANAASSAPIPRFTQATRSGASSRASASPTLPAGAGQSRKWPCSR